MPRALTLIAAVLIGAVVALLAVLVVDNGPVEAQQRRTELGFTDNWLRWHTHRQPARPASELTGQDALGAIQEVTGLLLADPRTDWDTASITRLRDWLADWNRLMLDADVTEEEIDGGIAVQVDGDERVLEAARRLLPGHMERLDQTEIFGPWETSVELGDESVRLIVTTDNTAEVAVIRGIGFFGLMSSGVYRPHALLAVARGRYDEEPSP